MFVKRIVIYFSKGGEYICQKDGNIFVKRREIYLAKGWEYICQKEGNIFVKRYLSKGG